MGPFPKHTESHRKQEEKRENQETGCSGNCPVFGTRKTISKPKDAPQEVAGDKYAFWRPDCRWKLFIVQDIDDCRGIVS